MRTNFFKSFGRLLMILGGFHFLYLFNSPWIMENDAPLISPGFNRTLQGLGFILLFVLLGLLLIFAGYFNLGRLLCSGNNRFCWGRDIWTGFIFGLDSIAYHYISGPALEHIVFTPQLSIRR